MAKFKNNKRNNLKEKCLQYLGGKKCYHCKRCDGTSACYDFHHKFNKDEEISKMISRGADWKELEKELDKCVVLDAFCHRLIHSLKIKIR